MPSDDLHGGQPQWHDPGSGDPRSSDPRPGEPRPAQRWRLVSQSGRAGRGSRAAGHIARRWRILRAPAGGLVRGSDRVEAAVFRGSLLVAVLLLPVLAGLGLAVDRNLLADAARQRAQGHVVVATLLGDAPPVVVDGAGQLVAGSVQTPATWRLPDGTPTQGRVPADRGLRTGAQVHVWVDATGCPAPHPIPATRAAAIGVLVGAGAWATAVLVLALGFWGVRQGLDRHRSRAWSREWALIAPDSSGRGTSTGS